MWNSRYIYKLLKKSKAWSKMEVCNTDAQGHFPLPWKCSTVDRKKIIKTGIMHQKAVEKESDCIHADKRLNLHYGISAVAVKMMWLARIVESRNGHTWCSCAVSNHEFLRSPWLIYSQNYIGQFYKIKELFLIIPIRLRL